VLWATVQASLPASALATIRQLNVVSDGPNNTLAMVHRSSLDPHTWVLSVDITESTTVLQSTLIHEYAHMLTMRTEDLLARSTGKERCNGVRIELGCALAGSALAAWHEQFWVGQSEPADPDSDDFVSPYAASSVHEDLAESFMSWILDDVDSPNDAVAARFAFFADRADFVEARRALQALSSTSAD
jgi:hypothetical protein